MDFIINNWYIILALAAVLGVAAWYVYRLPKSVSGCCGPSPRRRRNWAAAPAS